MKILVTNDDGYQAKGIHELVKWLLPFGEVIVVAPDGPRSAQSMAITVNSPLRLTPLPSDDASRWYAVNGTPVDCVKLSMNTIFADGRPDMVVAGINHGSNAGVNVLYSGTMGAVSEGCVCGIPSIGFSLTDHSASADFSPCRPYVERLVKAVATHGLPPGVCLNVNIPDIDHIPVGMRLATACRGRWTDEYQEYTDPHGKKFYFLTGRFINDEPDNTDTDEWCLKHELVSVVPTLLDRTATVAMLPEWLLHIGSAQE